MAVDVAIDESMTDAKTSTVSETKDEAQSQKAPTLKAPTLGATQTATWQLIHNGQPLRQDLFLRITVGKEIAHIVCNLIDPSVRQG